MNLGKRLKSRIPTTPFPNIPSVKESSFWQQKRGLEPKPIEKAEPAVEYETPAPLGEHNLGAPSLAAEEPATEETAPEEAAPEAPEEEDQVPPEEQGLKAADLRNVKEQVKQAKSLAQRAKEAKEKLAKAAEIAKQLRNVQNINQFLLVVKTATGITLTGLAVTYLIMFVQFILGNIFQISLVPRLGFFEGVIFMIITFALVITLTLMLSYITMSISSITSLFQ